MSELAFDENGQHFQVSAEAARWRTRRFNNPGKPGGAQVVYGDDGLPLFLDIEAAAEEFREAVQGIPGRYRLDAVDAHGRLVAGMPPAYLVINGGATASTSAYNAAPPPAGTPLEYALVEMARANSDAIKTMADKFGGICDSVANVMRAADGAGLPRRAPLGPLLLDQLDQDDDDDEERNAAPPPSAPNTIATVLAQVMQMVQVFTQMRGGDPAKVGAFMTPVVETAKVVEVAAATVSASAESATTEPSDDDDASDTSGGAPRPRASSANTVRVPTTGARVIDHASPTSAPATGAGAADPTAHFNQIMMALTPQEQARVQFVITTLSVRELMQWHDQLAAMSISDAVAKIRGELARVPMEQAA
jgi:hypothetical protein